MKRIIGLASLFFLLTAAGCERSGIVKDDFSYGDIRNINTTQWASLSKKRIFFGHQSVGGNIVQGMADILESNKEIKLVILNSDKPGDLKPGTFEHIEIGRNEQPLSKIEAFSNLIKSGTGNNSDIAFFKFCYIDINKSTDVKSLFSTYQQAMSVLKAAYPGVIFIHVTVPFRLPDKNIKYWVKKAVGIEPSKENNISRNRYNDLLRSAYEGKEPVFDLARLEAVSPDKNLCFFEDKGNRIMILCPEYTDDGGHLNALGRKVVAEQLLVFLAKLE